ncbi:hypothetical protein F5Y14DRAFT_202637 [Nemania sp. NC0429]|nr:hypothetical protein F5Y14DRAFT_202637 [Nemania sp. NC0429]
MGDTARPRVPYDVLLLVANFLIEEDLANLAAVNRDLSKPLSRQALKLSLIRGQFNQHNQVIPHYLTYFVGSINSPPHPPPLMYAARHGDIEMLARALDLLDFLYPDGWTWWGLYNASVSRLLHHAAQYSLEALQYLVARFPLLPASMVDENVTPISVLNNTMYSNGEGYYVRNLFVDARNQGLVATALTMERYDCASFLLKHQPSLFPNGFPLGQYWVCFTSATTLQFMIDHGCLVRTDTLHRAAGMEYLTDPRVFDILVKYVDVESPRPISANSVMAEASTPLCTACDKARPLNVKSLLHLGANPNGVSSNYWLKRIPFNIGFRYLSPNPLLTLLFSSRVELAGWECNKVLADFLKCLRLLLRCGASTSVSIRRGTVLELFVLRMWKLLGFRTMSLPSYKRPLIVDHSDPVAEAEGVEAMLAALDDSEMDVSPWDLVCEIIAESEPAQREIMGQTPGKAQVVRLLRHYQKIWGDLAGPAQTRRHLLSHMTLPDRFGAQFYVQAEGTE